MLPAPRCSPVLNILAACRRALLVVCGRALQDAVGPHLRSASLPTRDAGRPRRAGYPGAATAGAHAVPFRYTRSPSAACGLLHAGTGRSACSSKAIHDNPNPSRDWRALAAAPHLCRTVLYAALTYRVLSPAHERSLERLNAAP
jgi:hypothetical protein